MEDKFIFDKQAGELVNLRDIKGIWIYKDYEKDADFEAQHQLEFDYYNKTDATYLHYESSELLHNALSHYTQLLKGVELDVSMKPLTL